MKERKILTKLGIIFGVIDLLLILFGVIFLKPKQVLAETPDSFLMNELYLFNRDTFDINPNFEDGYLMKTTILPTDINSDNTSGFFGWYQSLGYRNLIIPYYGSDNDNVYVVLGVPLNNITASNFQIAYSVDTPTLLDFYLIFSDGTYEEWDTEQYGFNEIIEVSPSNRVKNCYAFCWEAYSPDYIPSFKFFGVSDGYDLGYQHGQTAGFESGFNSGYNNGYNAGYQSAIESGEVVYTRIQTFNQLVINGNFANNSGWSYVTINENTALLNSQQAYIGIQRTNNDIDIQLSHKYYCHVTYKGDSETTRNYWYFTLGNINNSDFVQYQLPNVTEEYQNARFIIQFKSSITGNINGIKNLHLYNVTNYAGNLYIKNIYIIDLTTMYGAGFEPSLEECSTIFYNDYYEYNAGTPLEIGYYTGYYDGKNDGLQEGINIGETNQINMGWIQEIFRAIQTFFNIQIFPHVTLGIIVGIPFIISLAWFVIKMFRGGGGGED